MKPIDPPHKFLIDRSLGNHSIPNAFLRYGLSVTTLDAEFSKSRSQTLTDVEIFEHCGKNNLILIMKDKKILRRKVEIEAIEKFGVRVFVLFKGELQGREQVKWFQNNFDRIVRKSNSPGPFVYYIKENDLAKKFPKC